LNAAAPGQGRGGILALAVAALALCTPAAADTVESARVGQRFWARPGLSETSVEFYADPGLSRRAPVYRKARFEVTGVVAGGPWPHEDPVLRIRFEDGREAWIDWRDFERRLYRELAPNQVSSSPLFEPPLGRGIQVHQFERASIFSADPDLIWSRVRNQGPRSFSRGAVPVERQSPVLPEDPVSPIIGPR
jgi:hypothetical protein